VKYRCPNCGSTEYLWEGVEVPGWRGLNDELESNGRGDDVDWHMAESTGEYGCSDCQWTGSKSALENLGIDGKPLPVPIPGQLELAS
jgi:hypothetical protein